MFSSQKKGIILINTLVFGTLAAIMTMALIGWVALVLKNIRNIAVREQAFQVAEAGVDYYRWHLAHSPGDFQDSTDTDGPYVHDFNDKNGLRIGEFSLEITPPPTGSTLVTIRSTGLVDSQPALTRTVVTQLAIPSFAKYAVVANDTMRFGAGTEIFGPIHSNGGIRFDGLAHNLVTSSVTSYNDPDSDDCNNNNSFGVHTCVNPDDPSPPTAVPSRTDVFEAGREFPVSPVDFVGITTDLSNLKTKAQAAGFYRSGSGSQGYEVVFKTNDTFDLYRVNTILATPNGCFYSSQANWGTWSIGTQGSARTLLGNYANPSNGVMFFEDHVWVRGQINTARITLAAGRFPDSPSTHRDIIINSDLSYTNYDGQDVIGLIAQRNVSVGLSSDNDLRIDAALIAQNGRVGRYYYSSSCGSNYIRTQLTLFGMIGTRERYGFAYTNGTGYLNRDINYDGNLLYSPPPDFPLTSDQYQVVSWQEEL
ncbi:MAG: hypothetical protein RJA61_71 [Candidatus Parcubacteria bacterium]|jgi:hypothetical protein